MTATTIDYLLIGHMTADLTPAGRVLGGTVSYAARTASAFGLRVGVLTSAVPNDPLIRDLRPYVDALKVVPAEHTSTFENIYTGAVRQQVLREVAEPLTYADVPDAWRDAPLVHFGPLTGEIDPATLFGQFPKSVRLLTAQGLLRQWDDSMLVRFMRWHDPAALANLDWLVLSEEDIVEAPDLEAAYAESTANFVLTRAENGGTYYHKGVASAYDTPQVTVKQPTGAGDVFAAGLLAGLYILHGRVPIALQVAAILGATAVTRDGWDGAPTGEEVAKVLDQVRG
jgi:1D-myo-inositol 3-kinase